MADFRHILVVSSSLIETHWLCLDDYFNKPDDEFDAALYYKHLSKKIEKESRVLFPFIFIAFCICYWVYYMVWSNELQTWIDDPITKFYQKGDESE